MTTFDYILTGVATASILWAVAAIRENLALVRLHEQDARDFEALALRAANFEKSTDEAIGTIVELYESELAK